MFIQGSSHVTDFHKHTDLIRQINNHFCSHTQVCHCLLLGVNFYEKSFCTLANILHTRISPWFAEAMMSVSLCRNTQKGPCSSRLLLRSNWKYYNVVEKGQPLFSHKELVTLKKSNPCLVAVAANSCQLIFCSFFSDIQTAILLLAGILQPFL